MQGENNDNILSAAEFFPFEARIKAAQTVFGDHHHSSSDEDVDLDKKMASLTVTSEEKKMVVPTPKNFPQQLMEILSHNEFSHVISWLDHGRAFVVHDKNRFIEVVSPCYFQETKFESFLRKLNRWGFSRRSKGFDSGAFFHRLFCRDEPDLCRKIKCKKYCNKNKIKAEPKKSPPSTTATDTSAPPLPSISLDSLKVAQMEQAQRAIFLKYLHNKQQYEQSIQRETMLRAQLLSQQQELMEEFRQNQLALPDSPCATSLSNQSLNETIFSWPSQPAEFLQISSALPSASSSFVHATNSNSSQLPQYTNTLVPSAGVISQFQSKETTQMDSTTPFYNEKVDVQTSSYLEDILHREKLELLSVEKILEGGNKLDSYDEIQQCTKRAVKKKIIERKKEGDSSSGRSSQRKSSSKSPPKGRAAARAA